MAYLTERVAQSFVYNVKTYLYARILRSGVTSAPIGAWKLEVQLIAPGNDDRQTETNRQTDGHERS